MTLIISAETILETTETEDYTDIPLSMMDIISICKDFNYLGLSLQREIDAIVEVDVEEAIQAGYVKQESLPHIKFFLKRIIANPYFGEAVSQAQYCLELIQQYEDKYQISYGTKSN